MDDFEALVHRWMAVISYADDEELTYLRQELSLSHGRDVTYLSYRAAVIMLRDF